MMEKKVEKAKLLESLIFDETEFSVGLVIFNFGKWQRHMKSSKTFTVLFTIFN